MFRKIVKFITVTLMVLAALPLNGCLKKKKSGDAAPIPMVSAPAPVPSGNPPDIGKDGAVIVFPRPLLGPITIDLSRK